MASNRKNHNRTASNAHLRAGPPWDGAEGAETREGVTAVGVEGLPEAEDEVGPEDQGVRAQQQRGTKGRQDVADLCYNCMEDGRWVREFE